MKNGFLFFVASLCLAFTPVSKDYSFEFKLNPDRTYAQTTSIATATTQTVMGQSSEVQQFVSVATSMNLEQEGDSMNGYSMWYDAIKMEVAVFGKSQKFDSDTINLDVVDATSQVLSQMTGKTFKADIRHDGLIYEVFGLEEIITAATVDATGIAKVYAEQFSGGFGDSGLAKNLEMVSAIWPDTPVSIGDSWTNEQYTPTGLPVILQNTFTLESVEGDTGFLRVDSKIITDKNNNQTSLEGMSATYYLDGSRTGSMEFEIETGWVTQANLSDDIAGNMIVSPTEQQPTGMTIPISFKNEITVAGTASN